MSWVKHMIVKASYGRRVVPLALLALLCACRGKSKTSAPSVPEPAHLTDADGTAVAGFPEPEIVHLESVETARGSLIVTVGNAIGDYALICNLDANKEAGIQSCLAPRPDRDYLLFRKDTKWLAKGAKKPLDLEFMQDFSVSYNDRQNIGLLPAKSTEGEDFRLFRLSSWKAKSSSANTEAK